MQESTNQELSTPLLAGQDGDDDPENPTNDGGDGLSTGGAPHATDYESVATLKSSNKTPLADYESHFTLRIPTSTVHFRGSVLRVIDTDMDQIILQQRTADNNGGNEDDGDGNKEDKILVKRLSPGTYAQRFLRVGYTLITILFLGFLFVFCFQVLLFLIVALPVDAGYTSSNDELKTISVISTLLSFPVMMYGTSSLMTMGSAFVVDTYNGAALFRSTIVEVLYMCVFVVVPALAFAINLLAREDEPWRRAASVWVIMVLITFCVWGLAVTYKQVEACFWLVERHFEDVSESSEDSLAQADKSIGQEESQDSRIVKETKRLLKIANRALILTQTARYSGEKQQRFNIMAGADISSSNQTAHETSISLYSRLTALSFCSKRLHMFETLDPPKRIYSPQEVRDIQPFMTKNNFSMQKMWCSGDSRHRNVIVARGPSALTPDQIKYSVLCTVSSSIVLSLLLLGAMAWMETGLETYILALVLLLLCCIYPVFMNAVEMYRMYAGVNNEDADEDEDVDEEANMFQLWETVRITQPKLWYCYARVVMEVSFLFLWPFISMLTKKNYPVAFIFFVLGFFTFLWRFFDACEVLRQLGSMSDVADESVSHRALYRLNEVIGNVISNRGRRVWSWIFVVFFLAILVLFLQSQQGSDTIQPQERATRPPILLPDPNEFYYPPEAGTIAYPTCKLTKGFEFSEDSSSDLGDYSFLSAMAYETSEITDYTLMKWFGEGGVVDEEQFVTQYREDSDTAGSPVYFKLFSVPSVPGYAVMSIRGSETAFDWLSNMQLWSAAGLAQVVKWLTPFGWVWEPILPHLIYLVNLVESEAISSVSYYKVTTRFVNDVLGGYGGGRFGNIHVTGASLGGKSAGGLAIITGAQTEAFTVAISGMGATLSRETFDPPIELEKLNAHTFNFIPERDFIARVGGRAPFFQNAACTAPQNDLFGCHSMWRSVCEINYRCGSNSRPVPCRCVTQFGYPQPVQNGTRSFDEACQEENDTWYEMFPPN
ncbi:hypothetical protein ACHAXR_010772 [Thalassiosira sp. AJA248-18]